MTKLRHFLTTSCALRAAILLALAAAAAFGQAIKLKGIVTDPQNAAVPGATVVLRGPGGERRTKTSTEGNYDFTLPQAGAYTITVTFPGFSKFEASNIQVSGNMDFDVPLVVAMEKQAVDVQDTDQTKVGTDPSQNASALVLKGADLDMLSDDPDQLADDLQALAGPSAGPNGGQIFIDGFSGGQLPPKSSIREIRVNQNPYSAEYDRLGFGRIEILTKPGTDKLRGQMMFSDSDAVLNARNPLSNTKPDFSSRMVNASVGGPLSSKSSFNLDFEGRWVDENALIKATILDSNFLPQSLNQAVVTPQTRWHLTSRVDYALNANNTLIGRYSHSDNTSENQGVGNFSLLNRAYNSGVSDNMIQLTETAVLGTHAVNETRFQYDHNRNYQNANTGTLPAINVSGAFIDGSPSIGLSWTTDNMFELSNMTTYTHGAHVMKWGGRMRHYSVGDASPTNFNGTYSFAGAYAPILDANNNPLSPGVTCSAANPNAAACMDITSIEQYRRTVYFLSKNMSLPAIRLLGGGATQYTVAAGNPIVDVGQFDIGIYAQDDWRIKPNFTLSYGLRYEAQTNSSDMRDFSPRLSIAWGLGGTAKKPAKTVLRAGTGIFYDRLSYNLTMNSLRYNGITQQQYVVINPNFYLTNVPALSTLNAQTSSRDMISNSIVSPYIAQGNIGIDRQLPKNITVAVNYIFSTSNHSLRTRNINAPYLEYGGVQPYGPVGNIFLYESSGRARQNQLIVNVNARMTRRVQLFGFYMAQNAHSNTDNLGSSPAYAYNESTEWGRSSFAPAHRVFMGGSITAWKRISLAPHVTAQTGLPFNIVTGRDTNGDTLFTERPALASSASAPGAVVTRWGTFNPNPGPNDTLISRNYGTGPGSFTVNLRVARTWGFGERATAANGPQPGDGGPGGPGGGGPRGGGGMGGGPRGGGGPMMMGGGGGRGGMGGGDSTGKRFNLTLAGNARNLFNHSNYGSPIGMLSSPQFGTYNSLSSGGFGPGGGAGAANNRRLDLSLRFTF